MRPKTVVTLPAPCLDELILAARHQPHGAMQVCQCGLYARANHLEFLFRRVDPLTSSLQSGRPLRLKKDSRSFPLSVYLAETPPGEGLQNDFIRAVASAGVSNAAAICIRNRRGSIDALGWVKRFDYVFPVDFLFIPGGGMHELSVGPLWPITERTAHEAPQILNFYDLQNRLSRVAGYFGEGNLEEGYEFLGRFSSNLVFCVIGAGRSGSIVVTELVKLGFHVVFCDDDCVEEHNRDITAYSEDLIGAPKVEALASMLKWTYPSCRVEPIVGSISDKRCAAAAARSHILISAVDDLNAAAAVSIIAGLYNRIHFNVSGGAAYTENGMFASGAEVMLSVPGSRGCLPCFYGIDLKSSMRALQKRRARSGSFTRERPGSSGTVLMLAVGRMLWLLERLLKGRQRESVWWHLDCNGDAPDWSDRTNRAAWRNCEVCSGGLRGLGDYNSQSL